VLLAALSSGCAATASNGAGVATRPFTPELAPLFDDAADFIEDVDALGGRIAADWRRQVRGLSLESDLIVAVRVETVTLGDDNSTSRAYRLTAVATRDPIHGVLPPDRRVDLRVSEGDLGFNAIHQNEQRLQSRSYILFARWYDAEGTARAHWHLSPETEALTRRVREVTGINDPSAPRETVVRQN
jgi:heme-degrading monooxygenase HmoA